MTEALVQPKSNDDIKNCPFCGETIKKEAIYCRYCRRDLTEEKASPDSVVMEVKTKSEDFKLPGVSIFSYLLSVVFIGIGFYKMLAYNNGENYPYEIINAYVGGDAYNYIINANYAVAYFVLALMCILFGSTFAIVKAITIREREK